METLKTETHYFDGNEAAADIELGKMLLSILALRCDYTQDIVFVCIGTDRATGDCLGPLVGNYLVERLPYAEPTVDCYVYGTLENPVHAMNLAETIEEIQSVFENPFVIAIDASLGECGHIGYVTLSEQPILPGKGVQKKLPPVGDISITGIVNLSGINGTSLLQSTRLFHVMELSATISDGILYAFRRYGD